MDKKENKLFGSKEATLVFARALSDQYSILMNVVKQDLKDKRILNLKIVLGSICQTAAAIVALVGGSLSNEATMLMRGFIEKSINFCYLLFCDDEEYDNYRKYSLQKGYRKLDREIIVGDKKIGVHFTGKSHIKIPKELKESIEQFTGKKGGEKTRWTKLSLMDRLEIIAKQKVIKIDVIMLSILSFYEDASEALHGTFYGCAFHTGYHLPGFNKSDKKKAVKNEQKNLSLLLVNCISIITDILRCIGEKEDIKNLLKKAVKNEKRVVKLMDLVVNDKG